MKKFLVVLILVLSCSGYAYAEEQNSDDWGQLLNNYNNTVNQNNKEVSPQEYEQAIQTLNSYKKKPKVPKDPNAPKVSLWAKLFGSRPKYVQQGSPRSDRQTKKREKYDYPPSPDPLLRLYADVSYKGKVIRNGFYIIKQKDADSKHYLQFIQAGLVVAEVETSSISNITNDVFDPIVTAEVLDNQYVSIMYQSMEITLQANLPLYFKP